MTASEETEKFNKLLKTGMNLDATDDSGNTTLHIAVNTGAYDIVSSLIDQGASPLDLAREMGRETIIPLLTM